VGAEKCRRRRTPRNPLRTVRNHFLLKGTRSTDLLFLTGLAKLSPEAREEKKVRRKI
jgi:hypothetical protein